MIHKFNIETKGVALGIWDSSVFNTGPESINIKEGAKNLKKQASLGELFCIYTGINEIFPVEIYINESIPDEKLKQYKSSKENYFIQSSTGNMIVDDLLEFRHEGDNFSREVNKISVDPGAYKLLVHEFDYDQELINTVGKENLDYYKKKFKKNKILAIALISISIVLFFVSKWYFALAPIFILILVIFVNMIDQRFHDTCDKILEYGNNLTVPYFIIELINQGRLPEKGGVYRRDLTFPACLGRERLKRSNEHSCTN